MRGDRNAPDVGRTPLDGGSRVRYRRGRRFEVLEGGRAYLERGRVSRALDCAENLSRALAQVAGFTVTCLVAWFLMGLIVGTPFSISPFTCAVAICASALSGRIVVAAADGAAAEMRTIAEELVLHTVRLVRRYVQGR